MSETITLCPDDRMTALLGAIEAGDERGLPVLLGEFPRDPRLHFLEGSLLAARQDYAQARLAMRKAVDIAPDFAIARFQLGFLLLTSGEAHAAQEAWGPLFGLPDEEPLRLFARGLSHMIRDEFDEAIEHLERGITRNTENLPLNRDMRLLIDEMRNKQPPSDGEPLSAASLLLRQTTFKPTRH
ncbi:tetratricopeptide repeat protein [Flavisphingomonas formosensis]|uniref:tetratricopeptide repeat protein n=1 Tax=Flavisphingomonas formosensis TaxID=861534 RepID=UPI0012FC90D2|nr:tetratricopeptide repeat protein [Sphingomonas formosensis]